MTAPETSTSTPDDKPAKSFRVANRLHFLECPTCGILFAVPTQFYLIRLSENGNILCPMGDTISLKNSRDQEKSLLAMNMDLLAGLRRAELEIERLKDALTKPRQADAAPTSTAELKRRALVLVNRKKDQWGRSICHFCGKQSNTGYALKVHMLRRHKEELAELPADAF